LALQVRIVSALAERDMQERTAKGALGAFGVLVEPMLLVGSLLALRILIRQVGSDLINPVLWMVVGVSIYYLFMTLGIKSLSGVKKSQDVFFYRRIRPLDTLLASALVESRIYATILTLVTLGVWIWTWRIQFDKPGEAALVFVLTVLLALGVGVSALVIGHKVPLVKLVMRFGMRRILLWTSGVFYAVYTLPGPVRPWLTWNPVLHAVELFRHSINGAYPIPDISLTYLTACALVSCGFGLLFYSANEALLLADD
jgi:capsular polysaccharide transport system permease protein